MKYLKQFICLIVLMLSATFSFAQKCHFDVDKKNDFTGENVRNVRIKIGNFMYSWWILLEQKGPKYYITVQSAATGKIENVITKGSKILFKLEDGKVVEVVVGEDCVPNYSVQSNTIITTWLPKGEVTKEVMQQLGGSPATMIRMSIGDKDFDSPTASGKEGRKLMDSALCMLNN